MHVHMHVGVRMNSLLGVGVGDQEAGAERGLMFWRVETETRSPVVVVGCSVFYPPFRSSRRGHAPKCLLWCAMKVTNVIILLYRIRENEH